MKTTVFSICGIIVAGTALGLGFNEVRSRDRINLKRNYFLVAAAGSPTNDRPDVRADQNSPEGSSEESPEPLQHPFAVVTLDEMVNFSLSPQVQKTGEVVFVDARDLDHFEEGHIPHALSLDNYNFDDFWDPVQELIEAADIVIVYCGGGRCEDSIFLATELESRGIPRKNLRVFERGIKAWEEDGLELETGLNE